MIFKWLNESEIMMEGDKIEIFAPAKTDFLKAAVMLIRISKINREIDRV